MAEFKVFGSELDDSLDTNATLLNNWPSSMTSNGRFVDGEDDIFDRDDELDGILDPDSEAREEIQVGSEALSLAPSFCTNPDELDRIFSVEAWNNLPHDEQRRLMTFLPNFHGNSSEEEKLTTITMLLTGQNFRFGNPVDKFKSDLLAGKLSPDSVKMTKVLQKAQFRKYKSNQLNYSYTLLRDLLGSRKKVLEARTSQPVKTPLAVLRMKRKSVKARSDFDDRVAKRYFKELNVMRQGEGGEGDSSEDENYPNGPPSKMSTSQKREVSLLDSDYWSSLQNGSSKLKLEKKEPEKKIKLERDKKNSGTPLNPMNIKVETSNPFGSPTLTSTGPLTSTPFPPFPSFPKFDEKFSNVLNSSFESLLPKVPVADFKPLPNLLLSPTNILLPGKMSPSKMSPIKLSDSMMRKTGDDISLFKGTGSRMQQSLSPPKSRKAVNDLEVIEEAVANIPGMDLGDSLVEDFDLDFCFDSVEQLANSSPQKSLLNRSGGSSGLMSPPLTSESCACFFSLLRDKFRSSLDYKMNVEELEEVVAEWESLDASQIPWFTFSPCWSDETRSAVAFLSNSQPQLSPQNFSPFLNCCDRAAGVYQWIGTGRDADLQLQSVCQWWFDRRQLCYLPEVQQAVKENYNEQSSADLSPQIHQPTLSSSSPSFVADFHTQERERMFNPTNTYTYRLNDFSVTVGPIRAPGGTLSTTPCKGKSHPLLVADRPAYITIIVIVRDAVARLRNGEGTRQHICELVKESQFINQDIAKEEKMLTSAVSGALDRLQGETDPCCKYDTSKKTWQYLHLGRTSEDFVRMYNEQQISGKSNKSKKQRKSSGNGGAVPSPIIESLTTSTTTLAAPPTPKLFVSNPEDIVLNAVNSILPTEPLQRSELPGAIQLPNSGRTPGPPTISASLLSTVSNSVAPTIALPSEPLPPVSVMAPVQAAPVQPASASVQMIQVMTSQGLKTFRLTNNKATTTEAAKTEAADSILKIQQPLPPIQIPSANSSLLRAKLPTEVVKTLPFQHQQPSTRIITTTQSDSFQSSLKVIKPDQISTTSSTQSLPQVQQNVQRLIVKDSQGKSVQISSEAFQKLLASRSIRPAGSGQTIVSTQSPQSGNIIRIQRPQSGDASVVQVVQRPVVKTDGPRQTVVKIQGNLGNLSQQQLQTVQLLSSGGAGTAVRLVQASQPQSSGVLPSRIVVSSAGSVTSSTVTATPSSIVSIGGRQYILANSRQQFSTASATSAPSNVVSTPTTSSGGHFVVQSSSGKPIVLSQEQLQQFQQLQNIRIVQASAQQLQKPLPPK